MTINQMLNQMENNLKEMKALVTVIKYTKKENAPLIEMRMKNYDEFFKYMNARTIGKKEQVTRMFKMSNVALNKLAALAK